MVLCDYCKNKCTNTFHNYGIFICKENITLCTYCNTDRLNLNKLKINTNIFKFLCNREILNTKIK